jgi:hypothetical protein
MITLSAPSGASEPLAHAIELVNRDLDGVLEHLDTEQQIEFWTNLHQFALAETRGEGRTAHLIAAERVNTAVREALAMADEKFALHLVTTSKEDRDRFWRMLHEAAEQQIRDTKSPKARHGGGGGSA